MITVRLLKSSNPQKKYKVIVNNGEITKTIHFGQGGAMDFIKWNTVDKRKALERRTAYIRRHFKREDWNKSGIMTAGFWSKWLLWNKPTLEQSINDIENRFNIKIS